jgi:iron complex transport system substrate-binding protein
VTVHAANGAVTVAAEPHAIVSLSPTATEDLYAIGAGSQVVAVDKNSDYPAGLPTDRIDAYHLNVEALAKFRPDLVVAAGLTAAQLAQLRTLGITVLSEPAAARLSDAYRQIVELGDATGHAAEARSVVAAMKHRIAAVISSVPKSAAERSYYYELDQTYYSVTSSTFIGQLLGLLGLHSIADAAKGAAASGGYPQLDAEFILKSNPDYVFLADTLCCRQSTATVTDRPGWSTLTAVKDGRVVELNDDIASRWGPRIVDLLRTVANAIDTHPVGP